MEIFEDEIVRYGIVGSVPPAFRRRPVFSCACSEYLGGRRNRLSGTHSGWQKKPGPVCAWPIDATQPVVEKHRWDGTKQEIKVIRYPSDCHSILRRDSINKSVD